MSLEMQTLILYPGVELGDGSQLGPFVVLGMPPQEGELPTHIGPGAVIRSHTVIYAGNRIGAKFQTGHGVLVRESNEIGDNVSIGSHSVVEHHVRIGNGVRIHSLAFVPEFTVLEDECWIGPSVCLTNARYPRSAGVKDTLHGPIIERSAKIGAGAIILPGVRIGVGALIGAGSVVTKDVPENAVVAGNPARFVRRVEDIDAYRRQIEEMGKQHDDH
jgi:acetyltransferase-like isoleucine patch superfamily enzyme